VAPYRIHHEDIRAGGLANRFDVIIFLNTDDGLKSIINGIDPTHSPLAYGYPEITSAFQENQPLYRVRHADEGRIVLQWGTKIPTDDEEDKSDDDSDKAEMATKSVVLCGGIKGAEECVSFKFQ